MPFEYNFYVVQRKLIVVYNLGHDRVIVFQSVFRHLQGWVREWDWSYDMVIVLQFLFRHLQGSGERMGLVIGLQISFILV